MPGKKMDVGLLEKRRLQAWLLHCDGLKQTEIAIALKVTQGAVSRWIARARAGGTEGLRIGKPTGVPPRLPRDKQQLLPALLLRGPEAYGFAGGRWTRADVGKLIEREFGVHYSEENISYILRKVGWQGRPLLAPRSRRAGMPPADVHSQAETNGLQQQKQSDKTKRRTMLPSLL